jgi:hypothetical protein
MFTFEIQGDDFVIVSAMPMDKPEQNEDQGEQQ